MPYQEIKNVILEVNEAVLTESMIQVRSGAVVPELALCVAVHWLVSSLLGGQGSSSGLADLKNASFGSASIFGAQVVSGTFF